MLSCASLGYFFCSSLIQIFNSSSSLFSSSIHNASTWSKIENQNIQFHISKNKIVLSVGAINVSFENQAITFF
jgi:ABC-type siderophore export system fused ATPase/permease subunit